MVNFFASEGTDLIGGDFRHSDRPSVIGREFDLVAVAAFIDVNDCSNITHGKPVLGKVRGQRHAIQLFDYAGRGYAVMKRGASLEAMPLVKGISCRCRFSLLTPLARVEIRLP